MNDKQQLAAIGAQYRLTEEQAKLLAERMPQTGALQVIDDEPLCMAKRIDELEAQVRVMHELLTRSRSYISVQADWGRAYEKGLLLNIDAALAGKLPERPDTEWTDAASTPTAADYRELQAQHDHLQSKYNVALDVVRDLVELPYSTGGLMERLEVRERARDLLAGKVPDHAEQPLAMVPEGWIPVTERTPADERDVWCFGSSEGDDEWHGFVGHRNTIKGEWWEHNNGDYIDGGYGDNYPARVTHWMPLPASPSPDTTK